MFSVRPFVSVFLFAVLAGVLPAQRFEFAQQRVEARLGDVVTLDLRLMDVPEDLAAVTFGLRVDSSSAGLVGLEKARVLSAPFGVDSEVSTHYRVHQPAQSGILEGEVAELRVVVMARDTATGLNLSGDPLVARIQLPIAHEGAGRVVVELTTVLDESGVPLSAPVLLDGSYSLNAEGRVPAGDVCTVVVNPRAIPTLERFSEAPTLSYWSSTDGNGNTIGDFVPGSGLRIPVSEQLPSTMVEYRKSLLGPWRPFIPNTLVEVQWDAQTEPAGVALRHGARTSFATVSNTTQLFPEGRHRVPSWVEQNVQVQVTPFFGSVWSGLDSSPANGSFLLQAVDARLIPMDTLKGRQLEYNQRFILRSKAQWEARQNTAGATVRAGEKGLEILFDAQPNSSETTPQAGWMLSPRRSELILNTRKLYLLEATIHSSAETRRSRSVFPQLLLSTPDYGWSHQVLVDFKGSANEQLEVRTWFSVPKEFSEKPLRVEFLATRPGEDSSSTTDELVALDTLKLTSYVRP